VNLNKSRYVEDARELIVDDNVPIADASTPATTRPATPVGKFSTMNFGNTVTLEVVVLWSDQKRFGNMKMGTGLGYMYSPAKASYKDDNGAIYVTGSLHSFQLYIILSK